MGSESRGTREGGRGKGGRDRGCRGGVERGETHGVGKEKKVLAGKKAAGKVFPPKFAPPKGKISQRDISFFVLSITVEDLHFPTWLQVVETAFK